MDKFAVTVCGMWLGNMGEYCSLLQVQSDETKAMTATRILNSDSVSEDINFEEFEMRCS